MFYLSHQCQCHNFQFLDSIYWNFLKKSLVYQLYHLLGIYTDPDPDQAKRCRFDPIRIHNATTPDPWHFGTDPDISSDPYLWLTVSDADLKNCKKYVWWLKSNFWQGNFCIKILFATIISVRSTLLGKGKDPDLEPDPYLWITDPDAHPGGQKTYGSYGAGCGTLNNTGCNTVQNCRWNSRRAAIDCHLYISVIKDILCLSPKDVHSIWEQGEGRNTGQNCLWNSCDWLSSIFHISYLCTVLTIYTAPSKMFLCFWCVQIHSRRASGRGGWGCWALEIETFWALKCLSPKDVAPGGVGEGGALVLRNMIERAHGVHVEVGRLPLSQLCTTTPQPSAVSNISYGSGSRGSAGRPINSGPGYYLDILWPLRKICCQIQYIIKIERKSNFLWNFF